MPSCSALLYDGFPCDGTRNAREFASQRLSILLDMVWCVDLWLAQATSW